MTIRSLLEHVGVNTTGKAIYVGDRMVDKPRDVVCPVCCEEYEFFQDGDGDWVVDAEWWFTPTIPFLDSRHCYLKATGYRFDKTQGRWVK